MTRPVPLAKGGAALLLPLVLTSCFTMMLWGFTPDEEVDPVTGEEEAVFAYDEQTEWSWGLFFGRLGPHAMCSRARLVTCPVQAFWFGWDDEDDCAK